MTPPNIDLVKLREICPELHEVFTDKGLTIELDVWAIAATMLKLAEENERLRRGIEKFGDIFVGCYECKKKVKKEIKILEEFLAARKGNGDV